MSFRDEFDLTPQQYHGVLDKLWAAMPDLVGTQREAVWDLIIERLAARDKTIAGMNAKAHVVLLYVTALEELTADIPGDSLVEKVQYLMRRVDRDLSSLLKILDKIDHASLAAKRKITIPFVKELI